MGQRTKELGWYKTRGSSEEGVGCVRNTQSKPRLRESTSGISGDCWGIKKRAVTGGAHITGLKRRGRQAQNNFWQKKGKKKGGKKKLSPRQKGGVL